jgi:hypothetical protein
MNFVGGGEKQQQRGVPGYQLPQHEKTAVPAQEAQDQVREAAEEVREAPEVLGAR